MALQVNQPSDEQTQQENSRQGELHKSVHESLLNSDIQKNILTDLGLSPKTEEQKPVKKEVEVPQEEDQQEEVQEEEQTEEVQEEEQQDNSEEDEEVIPKSKVQKRFDELVAKQKALQRELEELRAAKNPEPKDEITKQLETMTPAELKAAKLEVRKAQIKAQNDDSKLNELLALEDKIDSYMADAPKNFAKAQAAAYEKKAAQIAESGEIPNLEKVGPDIVKLAGELYNQYPMLQKDINGQAVALELAVKHFKAVNSVGGDKTKEVDLKRQVNNLKRKTTLDTKTSKTNVDKSKLDTLRKNAMGGTNKQKVELVRSHPMFNVDAMIPDEFKER